MKIPILTTVLFTAAMAQAQAIEGTRINRAGYVITQPGVYILDRDLSMDASTPAPAIDVMASNVTVNLNGHALTGPGGKNGTGIRIRGVQGVAVHGGSIVNFAFGVMIANSSSVAVRGLSIRGEGLPIAALPPETAVMIVQSRNVTVEDNHIFTTGLGIFVRGGMSWGNRIVNNNLTGGANAALGICYNPADGDPQAPRGDVIAGNHVSGFGTGIQMSATSAYNILRANTVASRSMAIENLNAANKLDSNIDVRLP